MRATPRRPMRPPKHRSGGGPLAFVLVVMLLLAGFLVLIRPVAVDAVMDLASGRDGMLRQSVVRALVASRIANDVDLSLDPKGELRDFEIPRGSTVSRIAQDLQKAGLIKTAFAFEYVVYDTGRELSLQSGTYRVSAAMTPRELAKIFERAPGEQSALKLIEGWRLTEIANAVSRAFPTITKEAFTAAAVVGDRQNTVLLGLDPKTPLEGFLYPDTYFFRPDATAKQIVDQLVATFEDKAGAQLRTAAVTRKTTIYDIVKLASIVEREARDQAEAPIIAGVYTNRLKIGMKLDADPTVQYAGGDWGILSLDDLKIDSPYNTYRVAGLPPTPICSPGLRALLGAATPAQHDYLYFVARGDASGDHLFAKTIEEQEANRVKVGNK